MPGLTGFITALQGDTDQVFTTLSHSLGARARDRDGNEYVLLAGAAGTVAGSWVSFDELHATTPLNANAKGRVAIAMAAIDAVTKYGWYQIYGINSIAKVAVGFLDNGLIYGTATPGVADDAVVAGDLVLGAVGRSAVVNGAAVVELNYPMATDALG